MVIVSRFVISTSGRNRTGTGFTPLDFESSASTSSATDARFSDCKNTTFFECGKLLCFFFVIGKMCVTLHA